MGIVGFKFNPSTIVLGFFSFVLIFASQMSTVHSSKVDPKFIAPPPLIERFVFGYNESLADVFWIRAIQDFSYCDSYVDKNVCKDGSWLFQVVDTVVNLSPSFYAAYFYGGVALSVIITDKEGARRVYEKGIAVFPNDWTLKYYAAYHYIYEVGNKERAAELLVEAGKLGAPPWVSVLAGRLYSENGRLDMAESVLDQMIKAKQSPDLIDRLKKKIEDMKKKLGQ